VRIDKWRREVEQAKAGREGQDQEKRGAVTTRRRPLQLNGSDGGIKFGSLDVRPQR